MGALLAKMSATLGNVILRPQLNKAGQTAIGA